MPAELGSGNRVPSVAEWFQCVFPTGDLFGNYYLRRCRSAKETVSQRRMGEGEMDGRRGKKTVRERGRRGRGVGIGGGDETSSKTVAEMVGGGGGGGGGVYIRKGESARRVFFS